MYPRSRSKAFRNAILWTWWLPLLVVVVGGGWWHHYYKNQPEEWVALGKIIVTLPGGEAPDEAVIQAHVSLLTSSTVAEQAATRTKEQEPDQTPPKNHLKVTDGKGGLIHVTATGSEGRSTQIYLNEGLAAYIATVENMHRRPSPAGEKLNRKAVPMILELAGPAVEKRREFTAPMVLIVVGGGMAGMVLMFLISGVWALFRPASTQPSLDEIVKASAGLDATSHAVLVAWLKERVGSEMSGDFAA
ncbi:hypothetical protein [Roseimicrobium sp. ORNL1]|uniref:hypothetical protein n=1 Tax=Roseimicrobium sp. ORNL1 TaxID=2711231 RepID=UPI0013E0FB4A|nr:hypothetical protein [Roseimicrobium sp. ORNL1]QIF03455.1 hypothetical protein G5S37_18625 [Roseimicrobium sp. ORNL1]